MCRESNIGDFDCAPWRWRGAGVALAQEVALRRIVSAGTTVVKEGP